MPASSAVAIPILPPDLAALVRNTRAGDAGALGALYDIYAEQLYRVAYRLLGNGDDAQDVVHDCFVGLPEALTHYAERGRLDAWLRRIVVRLALMRRRCNARRREASLDRGPALHSRWLADAAALVFWSRYCGWALDDLDALKNVAERLERQGSQLVLVIDDEAGPSAALTTFLKEHQVRVPVQFDVQHSTSKALNNWGTPQYYVLDEAGRLRFTAVSTAMEAMVRAVAVRGQ